MTHLKKYWIWYLVALIVVVAALLAYFNWETVKGWFVSEEEEGETNTETITNFEKGTDRGLSTTMTFKQCAGTNNWSFGTVSKNTWKVSVGIAAQNCMTNEVKAAKTFLSNYPVPQQQSNCILNKNLAFTFANQLAAQLNAKYPSLKYSITVGGPTNCSPV